MEYISRLKAKIADAVKNPYMQIVSGTIMYGVGMGNLVRVTGHETPLDLGLAMLGVVGLFGPFFNGMLGWVERRTEKKLKKRTEDVQNSMVSLAYLDKPIDFSEELNGI